jgi:hypothetical protein
LKIKASIGMIPRGVSYLTSTFDRKDLSHNPDRQILLDRRETASAGYRRTYGISRPRPWISSQNSRNYRWRSNTKLRSSVSKCDLRLCRQLARHTQIPGWPRCWRIRTTQRQRRQESVHDWINGQKITLTCGGYTIPDSNDDGRYY